MGLLILFSRVLAGDALMIDIVEIEIHRAWFCWENDEGACGLLAQFTGIVMHVYVFDSMSTIYECLV